MENTHISNGQCRDIELGLINPNFDYSNINVEEIKNETEPLVKQGNETPDNIGLFRLRTANQVMKEANKKPVPKMLFDELWLEGELCILFADTGVGKSTLAVQIADSISKGNPIQYFKSESPPQQVIYFDFELSDKQFERRYTNNFSHPYTWSDNLIRADFSDMEIPDKVDYDTYLYECFWSVVQRYPDCKIIIIDNLTKLRNLDTDKAKEAKPLMDFLDKLKKKNGLSIFVLEHTRKRDESREISLNDLQGSAMKNRLIDAAFAIGRSSQDAKVRYIKQMKERSVEKKYGSENIIVCKIEKPHNFLRFEFLNFGTEREHLKQQSESEKIEIENNVKKLLDSEQGISAYSIAKRLCPDESKFNGFKVKISRIVNKINSSNTHNISNS